MKLKTLLAGVAAAAALAAGAQAQDYSKWSEEAMKAEIARIADTKQKVLMPMRDGVGLSTDIYRPKDAEGPLPTIFWRTPYNFNELSGSRLRFALESVARGYAFVIQNERGRYFSEGEFEILGYPQTDGYDALSWIEDQDWSNGKVGTIGCSSSAEWQLALAAQDHPAHAAMVPMSAGAGIGEVGEFHEQGNWYTGGVPRTLFFVWLYGVDNPLRAQIPTDMDRRMRARVAAYNDLAVDKPEVDWVTQIQHLPVQDILGDLGEPPATFEEFITREPGDEAWHEGGLYHENMGWGVPALWYNTWYDVSIGPNMALFNHVRESAEDEEVRDNQYAVVGPLPHCQFFDYGPNDKTGAREIGDTSFDTMSDVYSWFDQWLKGEEGAFGDKAHVRYYAMGTNEWREAETWPPQDAETVRLYLTSPDGEANSLYGEGELIWNAPEGAAEPDEFTYDPMNPVQTIGGGDCCNGGLVVPGAYDQRVIEARNDVLVYTSEVLEEPVNVTGFVDAVLNVSSDAPDTDFAVKLVDVAPDGTAWIIDDTILRARYREGFDEKVMMEEGEIYELDFSPMTTSNVFQEGHRIRVEVTSSNFPKFVRNLNTGGNNYDETEGQVAHNAIHLSEETPSYIELPVVE